MDQEVHDPDYGDIETATLAGGSRRRAVVPAWRVTDRRPKTWWSRLASLVTGNDDQAEPPEIETRGTSS
jgi:hypothetical protein